MRGCALPLLRRDRTFVCAAGHSYDVARSGYLNLLQPQDRKSTEAGDTRAAIEARASLLAAGVGRALIDAVASRAAFLNLPEAPVVTDLPTHFTDDHSKTARAITERFGVSLDDVLGSTF